MSICMPCSKPARLHGFKLEGVLVCAIIRGDLSAQPCAFLLSAAHFPLALVAPFWETGGDKCGSLPTGRRWPAFRGQKVSRLSVFRGQAAGSVEVFLSVTQAAVESGLSSSRTAMHGAPKSQAFTGALWRLAPVAQGQRSFSRTSFDKDNHQ